MQLEGLHILLTYPCTYECDHCFVWGSPWQTGTLTFSYADACQLCYEARTSLRSRFPQQLSPDQMYGVIK